MQEILRALPGMVKTDASKYEDVKKGATGHAESIDIAGSQYRPAIFYHGHSQLQEAEAAKQRVQASGLWKRPMTTEIAPAGRFWPAEECHQDYLKKHPGGYTCHYIRG
jgi:peptide methionine sulfoxide reductase msrA/msrB